MTEAEARARILTFANATDEPVLAPAVIETLLSMAKRVDEYEVEPTETGWTGTYDVNYAISQAWLFKASKLADRYLFMTGGKMFSRQQFYDHCMALYRRFAMKSPLRAARLAPELDALSIGGVPTNASAHWE